MIRVQEQDFCITEEYKKLLEPSQTGAIVTFTGRVRDFGQPDSTFILKHYPGMTEKVLQEIEKEAQQRWNLLHTCIIHRVGKLNIDDQIVFVGVSSLHRKEAFDACEYMIDILKTQAPFWKKEGDRWVDANEKDQDAADAWLKI